MDLDANVTHGIQVNMGVTEDGEQIDHFIEMPALATWGELLGYSHPDEVLAAILSAGPEPDPDPETGKNVWTDAYTLLTAREKAREDEAQAAVEQGTRDDPRSPKLRASLAAYNAVHQPINGDECAMDRTRRAAREALGCPEPSAKCGALSRGQTYAVASVQSETGSILTPETLEHLGKVRSHFLHSLTGRTEEDNPIGDTPPPPEPDNPILTADQLLTKYQEAS